MNHDIKITVSGHCGSGKTVLAYRILELLKADGWDIETLPMQVGTNTFVDEIAQQASRDPDNSEAAREYLRKYVKAKITEQNVLRTGSPFANSAS